jgi:nucleotide-binding universal stress UspA family protein
MKFKTILFPVDLSSSSSKIVPLVTEMAEKFGAKINILFVARDFQYFEGIYVPHPSIDSFEKQISEGAKKSLEEFTKKHFKQPENITTAVVKGDAAEQIVKYAEDKDIDLIIMGTHGRKGLDRVLFGSVAEKVSKTAPVPIMLINPYKVN